MKLASLNLVAFCASLLLTAAGAEISTAKSVESYYQQYYQMPVTSTPNGHSYRQAYDILVLHAWELPSQEKLAEAVSEEIDTMLRACEVSLSFTKDLKRDINYPFTVRQRLRGKLPERLIWLAACHGLARAVDDPYAYYMSAEEWRGIPDCGTEYTGPAQRPSYSPISPE